jgi:quercetin dioxygenase-like cupin family protein
MPGFEVVGPSSEVSHLTGHDSGRTAGYAPAESAMTTYQLRLIRDQIRAGVRAAPWPATNRVLYLLEGGLMVDGGGPAVTLDASAAWHGAGACATAAGPAGATVLRFELVRAGAALAPAAGSTLVLAHDILLEPAAAYLMRCDRVDFDPGGEALPHRHRGGGIRYLVAGTLQVQVEGEPDRTVRPGQAWFESGREAVHARASASEATSFIRCAILPREIRGQSSILYVDPAHAAIKPRRYTVFVDEPIRLS